MWVANQTSGCLPRPWHPDVSPKTRGEAMGHQSLIDTPARQARSPQADGI